MLIDDEEAKAIRIIYYKYPQTLSYYGMKSVGFLCLGECEICKLRLFRTYLPRSNPDTPELRPLWAVPIFVLQSAGTTLCFEPETAMFLRCNRSATENSVIVGGVSQPKLIY